MSKDSILLLLNIVAALLAIGAVILDYPILTLVLFGAAVLAYIAYIIQYLVNLLSRSDQLKLLLRTLPLLFLLLVAGAIFWFWPSTLTVALYEDRNNNALRDTGELGIEGKDLEVVDANLVSRSLTTGGSGEVSVENIARGNFRLKLGTIHILGDIVRGENRIFLGIPPKTDKTAPRVRMFLSDEIFGGVKQSTKQHKIYAHVWYDDPESGISKVEIYWGNKWTEISLKTLVLNYYVLQYEYEHKGTKQVQFRVQNNQGMSSFAPSGGPPRQNQDYAEITIE